jgi:hypothetical protein
MSEFPKLKEGPEFCPGGYSMFFYCKYENPEHPFYGMASGSFMTESDQCETRGEALRQAREAGWIYHRDGTATCPLCAKALRTAHRG